MTASDQYNPSQESQEGVVLLVELLHQNNGALNSVGKVAALLTDQMPREVVANLDWAIFIHLLELFLKTIANGVLPALGHMKPSDVRSRTAKQVL